MLGFIILFICYHYAELYMHEQTHIQTAINYGCDAHIELRNLVFAETVTNCNNISKINLIALNLLILYKNQIVLILYFIDLLVCL